MYSITNHLREMKKVLLSSFHLSGHTFQFLTQSQKLKLQQYSRDRLLRVFEVDSH